MIILHWFFSLQLSFHCGCGGLTLFLSLICGFGVYFFYSLLKMWSRFFQHSFREPSLQNKTPKGITIPVITGSKVNNLYIFSICITTQAIIPSTAELIAIFICTSCNIFHLEEEKNSNISQTLKFASFCSQKFCLQFDATI